MNIFWIVTDSICNYERADLHGLLPVYKRLKNNDEGFYFEDAISQFPSTSLSLLSFLTGRLPYYIFPDYYKSIENLPNLKYKNLITPLKEEKYTIESIIFGSEQAAICKEILNPYYVKGMYKGYHWLDAKEIYQFFTQKFNKYSLNENNLFFIFFRPSDPEADLYVKKMINDLKKRDFWENSIIIINSDHGYYDKDLYKGIKLMHFDDIHQSSMQPALFLKIPPSLTKSPPKIITKRVYLIDLMETVLDYLNIEANHERESISFRELIEKGTDINKNRKMRGDCYLMFQSIKRTMVIKDNWKLHDNNGKISLFDLNVDSLEKKDIKNSNPEIYDELFRYYQETEFKAYEILKSVLSNLYNQSILHSLESENIFIPNQFPTQIVKYLKEKLKINNNIVKSPEIKNSTNNQNLITILFYNRLTGYGLKKLRRKYKKNTKKFIILDTKLSDVSDQLKKTGYMKFVVRSIIERRRHFFQRWKEILVWVLYFPLYFNKHLRKFYIT